MWVCLPPSRPDSKRPPYQFVNGSDFLTAPVVPPELVKLLREGHKPKPREELEEECARVASAPPGQRNDILNKAVFKLAKLVAAGKLKESEVREALTKAALACALEPYEIERTLDSALSAGKRDAEGSGGRKAREKAQGRALELPDAVPWEEAVDGAALARALVADVKRFVVVTDPQADGLALWALHTHALAGTGITPRLAITSPVAACGKTTLLEWLGSVARRPLESVNISPSATFRTIEAVQPTLLVDEADTLLRENEELRAVLNSGHRVGGSVIRTSGDDFEPRCFSTWSACAIALIGKLPPTLESRSIEIALRRKMRSEVVLRWRSGRAEAAVLARQARRWAIDNVESLRGADPDLPEQLFNRTADNWRPLIAIADRLGADWPGRARIAAQELSGLAERDSSSLGIELLADIRAVFAAREANPEPLSSEDLIHALVADPEKPWAEYGKRRKPISQRQLAGLLKPFGLVSKNVRAKNSVLKGCALDQFSDVFERYVHS